VKGVDYVVHIASPLAKPSDDPEAIIIQPAIQGTLSILYSALKSSSVQKVVITASQASVTPMEAWAPGYEGVVRPENKVKSPSGPYANTMGAYAASKIMAYNRTLEFIEQEKPRFAIINVMPSFVVGKNELATTRKAVNSGSNTLALRNILGGNNPAGAVATTVHVDDVAFVHIAALSPKIEGNHNFACNSQGLEGIVWDDALDIVKKNFPKEVEAGVFPLGGSQTSIKMKYDASKTEQELNFKFKSFEEQILSLAGWYAEVAKNEEVDG